jgi:hypothetical protein
MAASLLCCLRCYPVWKRMYMCFIEWPSVIVLTLQRACGLHPKSTRDTTRGLQELTWEQKLFTTYMCGCSIKSKSSSMCVFWVGEMDMWNAWSMIFLQHPQTIRHNFLFVGCKKQKTLHNTSEGRSCSCMRCVFVVYELCVTVRCGVHTV